VLKWFKRKNKEPIDLGKIQPGEVVLIQGKNFRLDAMQWQVENNTWSTESRITLEFVQVEDKQKITNFGLKGTDIE